VSQGTRSFVALIACVMCCAATLLSGCSSGFGPVSVTNPDPSGKIPAIKAAVAAQDLGVAEQLVKDLNSPDAAIRFYSIEALKRLTGDDFGYVYYQDRAQRKPAVQRWEAWFAGFEAGKSHRGGAKK